MASRSATPRAVLACLGGVPWQAALLAAIAEPDSGLHVVRRCRDAVELVAAARAGVARIALLADTDLPVDLIADLDQAGIIRVDVSAHLPGPQPGVEGVDPAALTRLIGHLRDTARGGDDGDGWSDANLAALRAGHPARRRPGRATGAAHGHAPGSALGSALGSAPSSVPGGPAANPVSASDSRSADETAAPDIGGNALPATEAPAASPRVIAVWGTPGAPGVSTIALHLADEAARRGCRSLLIDADVDGGILGHRMALLEESAGLSAACATAEQADLKPMHLADIVRELRPGIGLLTGIPHAQRWAEWRPYALTAVWQAARAGAEVTVIDCGHALPDDDPLYDTAPTRSTAFTSACAAATDIVIVGSADPIGMVRLVEALARLDLDADLRRTVVLNRCRRTAFRGVSTTDLVAVLTRTCPAAHVVWLPEDRRACERAIIRGVTLAQAAPRSGLRRRLRGLTADLLAGAG